MLCTRQVYPWRNLHTAALVSDDAQLQVAAERKGCPKQIIEMVARVQEEETRGDVGTDTASRSREVSTLRGIG